MKKILVPVDGSKPSGRALDQALFLIEGKETVFSLTLVYVSPDSIYFPYYSMGSANMEGDIIEAVEKESTSMLTSMKEKIRRPGLSIDTVHLRGIPSHEICYYAEENDYDMIVMGNRGRGAFGEIILGSVSHKVLHMASCPVLIVK